jgi:predicted esterase
MREQAVEVCRTARYLTLGEGQADEVWMACHGYGQLARYFLRHFRTVERPGRLVIAPEGLSRFYLEDASGAHTRVGASWMTREDRLAEIEDHVRWLDIAFTDGLRQAGTPRANRIVAFGFSQGCATVARWLDRSPTLPAHRCDRLILWGGTLPEDVDLDASRPWLDGRLTLVAGDRDHWATPEVIDREVERLRRHAIRVAVVSFDGGHALDQVTLARLAEA